MSSILGLPAQGSNITVNITRVLLHPLCMFVEFWGRFSQERTAEYECLAKDIQSPGCTFQELEGNPCDQCLAQINGTWYRCRIISKNDSKYTVYLFDKGMTFSTTSNKMAWGKKEHFYLPPEVEFCVLANVLPLSPENKWSPVALEFLKSLCGKSVKAHVQDVLVPHRIFLLHIPCISTTMCEMGFAKKLFPDRFQEFMVMRLESHDGTQLSPESITFSMGTVERLHKQDLFMYPELPAGTVETVIVTEVTNPQQVFCQLKVFSRELEKISERLKQCCEGRMTSCVVGTEMIGCPCAARGNDGRWYRSIVKEIFPASKTVQVLNVDYGTKHVVQVENIRPLAAEFFRMPVVTYACSLHGISDSGAGWTSSQIDFLKNLLLCKTVIAKFEYQSLSESLHYVTLFEDENININNLFGSKQSCLLEMLEDYAIQSPAYSCQVSAKQERNQQMMMTLRKTAEVKKGKVVTISQAEELCQYSSHMAVVQHVSSPSEFWIQTQNYANDLNELMNSIYGFYKVSGKDVVTNPTVGLYCAARADDGDFYRAVVSDVRETQIKVFFVDYGSTEVVDRINIRTLPDEYKKLPQLALKCSLAGVIPKDERWSQSASAFFIRAVTDKVLKIHVTAKLDDCYVVLLTDPEAQGEKDIGKLMCSFNLAEKAETQREPKASISMQPAILPLTQPPSVRHLGLYRNNGMSSQTKNTVGLANTEMVLPKFSEYMFPIGSVLDVCVSYIESPNDFWCQLVQNEGCLKLLMHNIQAHYTGSHFQSFVETACVARHPHNRMWYRALIVHKHKTPHVDVLFVDYGQTETVSLCDLRRICPEFLTLQGQAFRCSLLNPVDLTSAVNKWNDEATARFNNFVTTAASNSVILKCTIYAVMYSEQRIVFNIVDLETPFESVCTSMVNLVKSAHSQKTCGPSYRLDTYYYSSHNIKTGMEEQVTVTCVNNVSQFYCQLERNTDVIKDLVIKVRNICCQLENVKHPPVFGTLCFAKYTDGQWYRGQIKATKPAIVVHFVDYGDTIEVDKSDLLPVPIEASDIMSVPVQAVRCSLSDVPGTVPSEVNTWFKKSVTDCKFRALVVAREHDGKLLVELYHGQTQMNSKIKKMFCISANAAETSAQHAQRTSEETGSHTKNVTNIEMSDDAKPAERNLQSAPTFFRQKAKVASLKLYRPPHQRQLCGRTRSNAENGSEPAHATVKAEKLSPSTDTVQLIKSKSPNTGCEDNIVKLPKVSDLPSNSVTLGMEADVYISHCNSPLSFYVQLVKEEDKILTISEKLNDPKSPLKTNDIKDLNPGDLVQAEFGDDSSWYRAVVREIHANPMAVVEFVDFGNREMTPISKIAALDKSFVEFPVYSTHCMLSSAVDLNKEEVCDPDVVSAFKGVVGNGEKVLQCRFIRQSGSRWEVSLADNGVNVTCKVKPTCSNDGSKISSETIQVEEKPDQVFSTIHVPENLYSPRYEKQEFPEGQQLEIYVSTINDAQTVWCQCADSEELDKIGMTVSELVAAADHKSVTTWSLSPGSPCIALFSNDNLWYRAEVINKTGDHLRVLFVDYGNMSQVNIADLRDIPPDLVKIPPQAFLFTLEGFDSSRGSWDSCAVDELSALTTDKLLQVTVTRVERNEEDVKCFVQMECDGQSVNERMKIWWRSHTTEAKPDEVELTPSYEPSQKCVSTVKEGVPFGYNNEEQLSVELTEALTTDNFQQASSPKTMEWNVDVVVPSVLYQTESKDILPCDSGIEETMSSPPNEKDDRAVFTRDKNVAETDKGSEVQGSSVIDCSWPDDLLSPVNEQLKYTTDMSELHTTGLEDVDTINLESSFDDRSVSAHDQDESRIAVVRESFVTSVTTVKMVPRETFCPKKSTETKKSYKDIKQHETELVFPCIVHPMQQLCDAPTDQDNKGEACVLQEEVPRVATCLKAEEVTCTLEDSCLSDVCTDSKEPSDDNEVTSAGDECLESMTSKEVDNSVTEDPSACKDKELFALSCEDEHIIHTDICSDMSSLVEQVTCLVGEICLTDCRDPKEEAETQDNEPDVLSSPQQQEDSLNVLSEEMSPPYDNLT